MIRVNQIKLKPDYSDYDIKHGIAEKIKVKAENVLGYAIVKKSLDARKKDDIRYILSVDVEVSDPSSVMSRNKNNPDVLVAEKTHYILPARGNQELKAPPVVVGAGPAGLFCAYLLSQMGYKPILIEQGESVENRTETVESFWKRDGKLNSFSNVQFGEGGAGTFSDGKLTTGIKDEKGRKSLFLETFVRFGAPENIIYESKPHVGTDKLKVIIPAIRNAIIENGGTVYFNTVLERIEIENGSIRSIMIKKDVQADGSGKTIKIGCEALVLAIGHSSRETIKMLYDIGVLMAVKPFAAGVRIEHLQEDINRGRYGNQYRDLYGDSLPTADYKLTYRTKDGHAVYSFCMCPGGYVVNASSEEKRLCINGMSYSGRGGENANAAIVVSVSSEDSAPDGHPLSAVEFQRKMEEKAFGTDGSIPIQRLADFYDNHVSEKIGHITPQIMGKVRFDDINSILPDVLCKSIKEAISRFGKEIPGFDDGDAIISAVESRTSSPIRMIRDENLESNIAGIYPCGEGAGYAGGIVSAAVDGIKVFEQIYKKYGVKK